MSILRSAPPTSKRRGNDTPYQRLQNTGQKLAADYHPEKNDIRKYPQKILDDDHREIKSQAKEAEEFLYDDVYDRISAVDKKYVKAGDEFPDRTNAEDCMDTSIASPDIAESIIIGDEILQNTESRFATKLQHHFQETATQPENIIIQSPEVPPVNQPTKIFHEHAKPSATKPPSKIQRTSDPLAVPPPSIPF